VHFDQFSDQRRFSIAINFKLFGEVKLCAANSNNPIHICLALKKIKFQLDLV
jgi:hypothetical protein